MPTLILEDGTGVAGANTWTTIAESDAYHSDMGHSAWAAASASPDDARTSAKIRAAQYINNRYVGRWPGSKTYGRLQSLQWPREDGVDASGEEILSTEIPSEVKIAQMEAELRELAVPGSLSPDIVATERLLRIKADTVELQYADASAADASIPVVTAIDDILAPLIGKKSNVSITNVVRN